MNRADHERDRERNRERDHERTRPRLGDFVDGALSASARRDVEAHLESCAACRELVAAHRRLPDEAASLARSIEPERDLWDGIRQRLDAVPEHRDRAGPASRRQPGRSSRLSSRPPRRALAAAATVLLIAAASALTVWLAAGGSPGAAGGDPDNPAGTSLVADWQTLELVYVGAAEELEQTLDEIGDDLSPETRRIVEQNLRVIDAAIAESRAALEREPANRDLARSLSSAWSSKVEMLQYVTRL